MGHVPWKTAFDEFEGNEHHVFLGQLAAPYQHVLRKPTRELVH